MTTLPREAREGLMRAWLKVLSDRHPTVTWVPAQHTGTTTRFAFKEVTNR
jgi:hypothetical protein